MRIAIMGCRGIPARYGGFETLADQLSLRLAGKGHDVLVYCRSRYTSGGDGHAPGIQRIVLPAIYTKHLETVSHSFLCAIHQCLRPGGTVLLLNNANAIFIPLLRLFSKRVFVHVDGLEWQRKKWGCFAKAWHLISEKLAARWAHGLISDSKYIADYYAKVHCRKPMYAPYGFLSGSTSGPDALKKWGLSPSQYLLFVGRMEPENYPDLVLDAYSKVRTELPLVMVGWAPYARVYQKKLHRMADNRLRFFGGIYGEDYHALLYHCRAILHASSVGGTHPVLVEAMGAGRIILASDIPENRETLGDCATFFALEPDALADKIRWILENEGFARDLAAKARQKAREKFRWEDVADTYERILGQG